MTEALVVTRSDRRDVLSSGTVGPPYPTVDMRLADVPEMNYIASRTVVVDGLDGSRKVLPPRGEVCVRSAMNTAGYLGDSKQTAELLVRSVRSRRAGDSKAAAPSSGEAAEVWLHSGDIGEWLPNGTLRLIDRRKNLLKLSQGEYVAVENVEAVLGRSPLIAQALVHGRSLDSFIVAVIVVDVDAAKRLYIATRDTPAFDGLADLDVTVPGQWRRLLSSGHLNAAVLRSARVVSDEAKLSGFETVKAIALVDEPFSVENGLLTPTFKLKRTTAIARFKPLLEALCDSVNAEEERRLNGRPEPPLPSRL
jgi:long-chain acyl-CoA synthetase